MQEFFTFLSQHPILSVATGLVLILALITELIRVKRKGFYLSPPEVIQMINHKNALVIDTRLLEKYRQGHIIGAISIPSSILRETPIKLEKYKEKPIIIICDTGVESIKLAATFYQRGYDTYALSGGLAAWKKCDLPLTRE